MTEIYKIEQATEQGTLVEEERGSPKKKLKPTST